MMNLKSRSRVGHIVGRWQMECPQDEQSILGGGEGVEQLISLEGRALCGETVGEAGVGSPPTPLPWGADLRA